MCPTEPVQAASESLRVRCAVEPDPNVVEREHELGDAERGELVQLRRQRQTLRFR